MTGLPARPRSTEELATTLREAYKAGTPVIVTGSNSHDPRCLRPENAREISTLRLHRPNEVTSDPEHLIIGAGITLDALQSLLAWKNRWVAIDPPARNGRLPGQRTLGGLIATNTLGPLRLLHDSSNNWSQRITGLTVVDVDGTVRQVQSLTEYQDGPRRVLAEVTLKTDSRPADERCLLFFCDAPDIAQRLATQLYLAHSESLAYLEAVGGRTFGSNTLQLPTQKQGVILIAGTLGETDLCEAWIDAVRATGEAAGVETLSQTAAQAGRLRLWLTTEPVFQDPDQIAVCQYTTIHVQPQEACERLHQEERRARQERRPFWGVCEVSAGIIRIVTL